MSAQSASPARGAELDPDLAAAVDRAARAQRLLVGLDFDGTLAPFELDPSQSRATPAAQRAVRALADLPDTVVALVSGRALDSLVRVSEAPSGVVLVGSHGLELRLPDGTCEPARLDEDQRTSLAELDRRLTRLAGGGQASELSTGGPWVERKAASVALHTRTVEDAGAAAALEAAARAAADGVPHAEVLPGKRVVEITVRRGDKGRALAALRTRFRTDVVFYAGDDVTDERAFRSLRLGDVGVHVGPGATEAAHTVPELEDVPPILARLATARALVVTAR